MATPLMDPGWVAFNEQQWSMTAHRFRWGSEQSQDVSLESVLYANASGKLRPVPHNIYCPVTFRTTSTQHRHRIGRQWLDASRELASYMDETGLGGGISLDLPVPDARAWQWQGFRVEVLYSFAVELPFDPMTASHAVRKAVAKGKRQGYICERTTDGAAVMKCVVATERRTGFAHGLSATDLITLQSYMGEDHCRLYVCRAPTGQPVSAQVVLHTPGARAVLWISGTEPDHLATRSTQLLLNFILEDLGEASATGLDFGGANLPHIAAYKAEWGGQLTTFYSVKAKNLRTLAQDGKQWLKARYRCWANDGLRSRNAVSPSQAAPKSVSHPSWHATE